MKRGMHPRGNDKASLCGEVHPDDGIDPRVFFEKTGEKQADVKTLRLCGQVARTLNSVFGGGCGDPLLQALAVLSVVPAPDASRLQVTVHGVDPQVPLDPKEVLERLGRARGLLRSEVAGAIQRKRTPELAFRVAAPGEPAP